MSMSVGGDKQGVMCDINTTPLIDVMLVLLVTIIMTLPVQTHAVKLNMPPPTPSPETPVIPKTIDIRVDFDDTIYWNNNPADLAQIEGYFRNEYQQVQGGEDQPEIHLRPDKRSHYDVTAKVLATAQRNHMEKIGFVNTTEFAD